MYRLPLADIICTVQWGLITSRLQTPKEQEPVHITFVYCDIMSLTNSITIRVQAITRSQLRNYLAPAFSSLFPVFPRYDKKSDVDDSQYPECSWFPSFELPTTRWLGKKWFWSQSSRRGVLHNTQSQSAQESNQAFAPSLTKAQFKFFIALAAAFLYFPYEVCIMVQRFVV